MRHGFNTCAILCSVGWSNGGAAQGPANGAATYQLPMAVLPLTETELRIRQDEGPQRRTMIELVDGDKPAETADTMVYACQVKVDGKKYWRVARNIVQKTTR